MAAIPSLKSGKNFRTIICFSGSVSKSSKCSICFTYWPCHKSTASIKLYFILITTSSIFSNMQIWINVDARE